jgi:hypothetical protein
LGPFASIIRNVSTGTEKIVEGDIALGLEMMLPAFLKQPMKAMRFASEGNITPGGQVLKPAEYYTYWKLTGQALGFGSTEVAESQVATYKLNEVIEGIKKEKNNMNEIKELKAEAYDILAQIEYLKHRLNQVNEQIQIKTNEKKELQNVTDSE